MKNFVSTLFIIIFPGISFSQLTTGDLQYWRPNDQRGINIFETSKADTVPYDGMKVRVGGNFTQQFQWLEHSNSSLPVLNSSGVNMNELKAIGPGFNLATANLNLDAQLADGVRLNLVTYLSSRHHPEAWVKGGYLQFDKLPFLSEEANARFMKDVTFRVGHMEINYGDAHFRRSDNGNALYNPFVGNYIMDAFTTEIGGEFIIQKNDFLLLGGITNGEIRGDVTNPSSRRPSYYAKFGYDKSTEDDTRIRLTGSVYYTARSINNTLYAGDRAGSRFYMVMENTMASVSSNFTSGRFNPGFNYSVTAFMVNALFTYRGFEFFGTFEQSAGKNSSETDTRTAYQFAADVLYRFGRNDKFFAGGRYNLVNATQPNLSNDISIERIEVGAGWFITKNILTKVEYVDQNYDGFPSDNIFFDGRFKGIMVEGIVAF